MEFAIRTNDLSKEYGQHKVVDRVNLSVKKGEIYGFLGQNGAGKTTAMRMMLGLIKPSSGNVEILGETLKGGANPIFSRIGSMIEFPGFYKNLSGWDNLDIHRRLMGINKKESIEEALRIVDILDARDKPVKSYSLGMKQRLGIARALLHQPELLLLDEPTNGLDPIGIKEIRQLILDLSTREKITVFMSSHILSEVQQIASTVGIIHNGKLVEEVDLDALQKKNRRYIEAKVSDVRKTASVLDQLQIRDYRIVQAGIVNIFGRFDDSARINRAFVEAGIDVREIALVEDSLEDYFIQLTGGALSA